ncbi:MAG: ATP-grasp domain-containing protein [Candidatus Eiseniibacteriota bacterium]
MSAAKLRVAVTGFDGLDVPHPGIAVARALREGWRGPVELHALGYDPLMTGAWMHGAADQLHTLPKLSAGEGSMLERLVGLAGRFDLEALVPTLDLEIPTMARIADRLAAVGVRTLLPSPEAVYATGKLRLPKLCHDNKFPAPRTIHVLDMGDLALHADQFGYPLFVKGVVAGAKRANDSAQARQAAEEFHEKWGGGVLLQQVIEGEEYNVAAVVGQDGAIRSMISIRKLGVNSKGKGIVCTVVDDPDIARHARDIIEALNWRGPLELEFVRPLGAKVPYLIEINCRFPSWIFLSHWAGANLPVLCVEEALGRRRERLPKPKPGTSVVRDVAETAIPFERIDALARLGSTAGTPPAPRRNRFGDPDGLRVAVSGVSTFDVVNAGLGTARALRGAPGIGRVYGLGYGNYDSGLYRSELFDATFRLAATDSVDPLLSRLREIHADSPFDVIVPCLDGEIPRYIEIRAELAAMGVRTLLPSRTAFDRRGKDRLFTDVDDLPVDGFAIPETIAARSEEAALRAADKLGFPVALKGPVSLAFAAQSPAEARAAWAHLRQQGCAEALVQRFVDGERFAVAAVCDTAHDAIVATTIKKLRICDRGSTWSAIAVPEPALEAGFARFVKALRWTGPVEGEFIRDKVTERFYLIEVNPRFTAWIAFTALLGVNHPLAAVRAAVGLPVEAATPADGLVFMRACEDVPLPTSAFAGIATRGVLRHA